jgi:hypothetical protein
MDFHLYMVYQTISSFMYFEMSFVLVVCYVNIVLQTHTPFFVIVPVFLSAMKLQAPCYELPPFSFAVFLVSWCENISTLK